MDYFGHFLYLFYEKCDFFQRREDLGAWTASGFEVCSSNLAAVYKINELNMVKENPRKELVSEEDTSSFRML